MFHHTVNVVKVSDLRATYEQLVRVSFFIDLYVVEARQIEGVLRPNKFWFLVEIFSRN